MEQQQQQPRGRRSRHHHHAANSLGQESGLVFDGDNVLGRRAAVREDAAIGSSSSSSVRRSASMRAEHLQHHHHHHHTCPQYKASSSASSRPAVPGRAERTAAPAATAARPGRNAAAAPTRGAVPGYQQDTFSSVRRSRERAANSPGSVSAASSNAANATGGRRSASAFGSVRNGPHHKRVPVAAILQQQQQQQHLLFRYENEIPTAPARRHHNHSNVAPASSSCVVHGRDRSMSGLSSASSRRDLASSSGYASPEDLLRIPRTHYQPHQPQTAAERHDQLLDLGRPSGKRRLSRNGSMNSVVSGFGTVSGGTANSYLREMEGRANAGTSARNLLRTFSFRDKPPNPDIFSSMPCLNNGLSTFSGKTYGAPGGGNNKGSNSSNSNIGNFMGRLNHQSSATPTSSSLVLNSLAYQILPTSYQNPLPPPPPPTQQQQQQQQQSQQLKHVITGNSNKENVRNGYGGLKNGSLSSLSSGSQQSSTSNVRSSGGSSSGGNANGGSTSPPLQQQQQQQLRPVRRPVADDADGHLAYLPGDVLGDRYEVVSALGEGTFGKVARCRDLKTGVFVATKIIKNIHKYREAAKLEVNVLRKLNAKDPHGR